MDKQNTTARYIMPWPCPGRPLSQDQSSFAPHKVQPIQSCNLTVIIAMVALIWRPVCPTISLSEGAVGSSLYLYLISGLHSAWDMCREAGGLPRFVRRWLPAWALVSIKSRFASPKRVFLPKGSVLCIHLHRDSHVRNAAGETQTTPGVLSPGS